MPGPLREVLARFAVSVDDAPLSKLDKRINVVKDRIASFAQAAVAGFSAAAYGAYKLVDAGSHANEMLNVLQQTFKGNTDGILAWSKTLGAEMGRSEYTLQESAGKFGSFLAPVFKDSGKDIGLMSTKLSQLSVDLASFYNTSDEEAQMRLFSGMSGETEAVRRLGIDISDTSLDDLNKKNGDHRRLASLTLAEKTALRFQKIMADTVDKQDDAKRTAGGWANSLKRVKETFKTAAVEIGKRLIPYALKMLNMLEGIAVAAKGAADFFDLLARRMGVFETATMAAVVALTAFLARQVAIAAAAPGFVFWLAAMTTHAIQAAAVFAKWALAFIVIEDFFQFFSGKNSLFGKMIKEITGLTNPLQAVKDVFEDIVTTVGNWITKMIQAVKLVGLLSSGQAGRDEVEKAGGIQKFLAQGQVDPDRVHKNREAEREAAFRTASESGDIQGAIDGHKGAFESKADALPRALQMRKEKLAIEGNQHLTTEADIKHGLAPAGAMLRTPMRAPGPLSDEQMKEKGLLSGRGPTTGASSQMVFNVNVDVADADFDKAWAKAQAEAKAKLQRAKARR